MSRRGGGGATKGGVSKREQTQANADKRGQTQRRKRKKEHHSRSSVKGEVYIIDSIAQPKKPPQIQKMFRVKENRWAWVMTLFFSYSPPPRLIPHHHRPPSQGSISSRFSVVSESFSSRDSNSTQKWLENDRKTTRNRLPGRGVSGDGGWVWGVGCIWKSMSLPKESFEAIFKKYPRKAENK